MIITVKAVVIVGTNHAIQRGMSWEDDFNNFLKKLCEEHSIKTVAEEINDNADYVVAKNVCQDLGIDHIVIDPNPTEYEQLGIKQYHVIEYEIMSKYDLDSKPSNHNDTPSEALNEFESRVRNEHCRPREAEWLKRIQEHDTWPILVIWGSNHFESFSNLLR